VITNLFLVSGVLLRLRHTTSLEKLGGLYRGQPLFTLLAAVPVFSLAGVPPLSGFLGKLAIIEGAFDARAYWLGTIVLVVGLLTLLSMARTWSDAFWRSSEERTDRNPPGRALLATIAGLSFLTLAMTVGAEPLFRLASASAAQLLEPEEYVRAVLGAAR
jgi:multicomponent Na+:H+ antiporter subunit D